MTVTRVIDEPFRLGQDTRLAVVKRGGDFMRSKQMEAQEAELAVTLNTLYFRGRTAVLGDVTPVVASEVFGIFPEWYVKSALRATRRVPRETAVESYLKACWDWGRAHFSDLAFAGRLADLLFTVVDTADASALPLFAGWRSTKRPGDEAAALAHALMVIRELRGGLHFAALRTFGLGTREAIMADRVDGGKARLSRSGWTSQDIADLEARTSIIPDLQERWDQAEHRTNHLFGAALKKALPDPEVLELHERLVEMAEADGKT